MLERPYITLHSEFKQIQSLFLNIRSPWRRDEKKLRVIRRRWNEAFLKERSDIVLS